MKYTGRVCCVGLVFLVICVSVITYYLWIPRLIPLTAISIFFIAWYLGKKYDQLKYQAYKDFLTNTYNRRTLFEVVPMLYKKNPKLTVLMIDIDKFKSINDRFGHDVGDLVLQKVAHLLIQNTRNKLDVVIRWGGDEFIILLSTDDEEEVKNIIDRLEIGFKHLSKELKMSIHASIGYTVCTNTTQPIEDYIRMADLNMYRHKKQKIFG